MREETFEFVIPLKIILNSNQKLNHYDAAARRRKIRVMAFKEFIARNANKPYDEPQFHQFEAIVHVCPPTRRRIDPPNLYPTVKPIIDAGSTPNPTRRGEVGCGLWEDDDWTRLHEMSFRYGGLSGIQKHYKIKLTLIECPPKEVME